MSTLRDELAEAEDRAEQLRRKIAAADCHEAGCEMVFLGGRNAGCELGNGCGCSVPVHVCPKCGDSDYGDNAEGARIMAACALGERDFHP